MTVKSLFDEKRRKEVRDAIRRGEAAFPKSGAARKGGGQDALETKSLEMQFGPRRINHNPTSFSLGKQTYDPDELLLLAIQHSDLDAADEALFFGADVNKRYQYLILPRHPSISETDCSRTMEPGVSTPFEYAKKLGNPGMVEFLKRKGGKG